MRTRRSKRNKRIAGQQPNPANPTAGTPDKKEDGPVGPNPESTPPGHNEHHNEPCKGTGVAKEDEKHWLEYATGAFAFIAAVGGILAAIFGGWQASVSSDTEKRQLRAYVGLVPGDVENFGDVHKQQFTFSRKNYGLTPAYDLVVSEFGESVIVYGQPIPIIAPLRPPEILRGNVTLFPSNDLPMHLIGVGLSKDIIEKVTTDDNLRFVYAGTVKYRDAFGYTHFTKFCWMYKRNAMTARDVEWCQGHNDSN